MKRIITMCAAVAALAVPAASCNGPIGPDTPAAAPTSPEGCMTQPNGHSKADHNARMAAYLRKAQRKGAFIPPAGRSYLNGKSPELTYDSDGSGSTVAVVAMHSSEDSLGTPDLGGEAAGPERSTAAAGRTAYSSDFTYWCGYGVQVFAQFRVLPNTTSSVDGTWVDYVLRTGNRWLGTTDCPNTFWVYYCDVVVYWDPAQYRLANIVDIDGTGPISRIAKDCLYF